MYRGGAGNSSSFRDQDGQLPKKSHPENEHGYIDSDESDEEDSDVEDQMEDEEEEEETSEDEHEEEEKDQSEMTMEEMLKFQEKLTKKNLQSKTRKVDSQMKANKVKKKAVELKKPASKTASKKRPAEMPLMRSRAPRMKSLDPLQKMKKKVIVRDPRFDDLSGTLDLKEWQKKYKFIGDMRKNEKNTLREQLSKERNPEKAKKLKAIIVRMENQDRQQAFDQRMEEVRMEEREKHMEALNKGFKPKYKSERDIRLMVKARHYETLKKENRVDKYMKRQEKQQRAKEFKRIEKFKNL